jgi:hypothetical protein
VRRLALLAALFALALPGAARATTEPSTIVSVDVSLAAHAVSFSSKRVPRGNYVQFRVRNATSRRHTFSLAGRSIVVPAKRNRLLVLFFDVRGRYAYVSRAGGTAIRGIFSVS